MTRSLNSPLFSEEDFAMAEQDVREAMAMKARNTSVTIPVAKPAATAELKTANAIVPLPPHETKSASPVDDMMDMKGILTKLLNEETLDVKNAAEGATSALPSKPTLEPSAVHKIPEFLKREKAEDHLDMNEGFRIVQRSQTEKSGISWKLPYAVIGSIITAASMISGIGFPTLFAVITMAPLIDAEFYKRSH